MTYKRKTKRRAKKMECEHCHKTLVSGAKFCHFCGGVVRVKHEADNMTFFLFLLGLPIALGLFYALGIFH
jgi:hypothetical protein